MAPGLDAYFAVLGIRAMREQVFMRISYGHIFSSNMYVLEVGLRLRSTLVVGLLGRGASSNRFGRQAAMSSRSVSGASEA